MKSIDFEKILTRRIEQVKSTLIHKRKEYATDEDILYNFRCGAKFIKDGTPEKALWSYATKHLSAIIGVVYGDIQPTKEIIDEKVGDMITYLFLLEATLMEKIKK